MFPKYPREADTLLSMESTMSTKVYAQSEEDKHTQRREPHSERKHTQREKTLREEKHMLTQSLSMQFSHQPIAGRRDHILLCN